MRRPTIILSIFALLGAPVVLLAPSASAAATCRFAPVLPSSLAIAKSVTSLPVRLRVSGPADCFSEADVSTKLVHGKDSLFLLWQTERTNMQRIYAGEVVPGVYRTTGNYCAAYDKNFKRYSCSVASAAITVKFAARPTLTATRSAHSLKMHAIARRYVEFQGFRTTRATVSVQRFTGKAWTTVHTGFAKVGTGYTWTYRNAPRAKYRVVSAATEYAFRAYSAPITR